MARRNGRDLFGTVRNEGAILPTDLLQRVLDLDRKLPGLTPEAYHLVPGESFGEATSRAWQRLQALWANFKASRYKLPEADTGTTLTRQRWLLPLFQELGYGRLTQSVSVKADGAEFPIFNNWGDRVPIHLVGCNVDLDSRTAGTRGAAKVSPHGLVQDLLNRSDDHLWAFVSNGVLLRVLRDSFSLTRLSYVQFDLEAMFEGGAYSDFALLWMVCHQSRVEAEKPSQCYLEQWSRLAQEEGTRALENLRAGVEAAISELGRGFLAHPENGELREHLRAGTLSTQDYYRQLLRLVYRLIFLFVAEDRDLLHPSDAPNQARLLYQRYYSTRRLRNLASRRRGTRHGDLIKGLRLVMEKLGSDSGCPELALPALGSFLWSSAALPDISQASLSNESLLDAIRTLALSTEEGTLRPVDFKNLGAEELGSVYESLLELHPQLHLEAAEFKLDTAPGHERKTTGSYYTPESLIQCLLDSALDPVLEEAAEKPNPEQAILALKVCDPACGSGHFLIGAAHRIAKRLASVRTGDDEPSPEAVRTALRDVIGRCLYGVDINPMSVELCKVALWMEALEPGKPLSFLDHHIRCGNSLLGTTPALMAQGIPSEAFIPIEGDDRDVCKVLKRRNQKEHEAFSRTTLFAADAAAAYESLATRAAELHELADGTLDAIRSKENGYTDLEKSAAHKRAQLLADTWCAAFAWNKAKNAPEAITHDLFIKFSHNPAAIALPIVAEVRRLAKEYVFFHWYLMFPEVFRVPPIGEKPSNDQAGWSGGFDVVLGNPPWERIKLQEKEWFAERRPDIATAPTAAARKRMIQELRQEDPALQRDFLQDCRKAEGESHFVRFSGRYPRCAYGDINTYAVFAELSRNLCSSQGRVGCIVPSGIATDDTTKHFFQDLVESSSLVSLFDFENRQGIFVGVHRSYKFCLLTMSGAARPISQGADFLFYAQNVGDLPDHSRRFKLAVEDIALMNPNSKTCPIFRSKSDADLTKVLYKKVPVLWRKNPQEENPWGLSFLRMFDMTNDSSLFRTRSQLTAAGWQLNGNIFVKGNETCLPLYEAKLFHHYDHRYSTFESDFETRAVAETEHQDPSFTSKPRFWVSSKEVKVKVPGCPGWYLAFRNVARSTDERTAIFSILPALAVGNSAPLMLMAGARDAQYVALLLANLSSLIFDYVVRQKVGGINFNFFILEQLPVLAPSFYCATSKRFILERVLELVYTSWDMEPFARSCGYMGPPFRWNRDRRRILRLELDAAFFHYYLGSKEDWIRNQDSLLLSFPTPRAAVDAIMSSFQVLKNSEVARFGGYRMKDEILDLFDAMEGSG